MAETRAAAEAPEYPAWWDFGRGRQGVEGAFVRAAQGYTQNGPRPFVVLDVDGIERTVWLHHEVLRNKFAREVHRRPDKTIHVGETIRIWQLEPRESQSNAGARTGLPGRVPRGSRADPDRHLGPPPEASQPQPEAEGARGGGMPDDDIPFA